MRTLAMNTQQNDRRLRVVTCCGSAAQATHACRECALTTTCYRPIATHLFLGRRPANFRQLLPSSSHSAAARRTRHRPYLPSPVRCGVPQQACGFVTQLHGSVAAVTGCLAIEAYDLQGITCRASGERCIATSGVHAWTCPSAVPRSTYQQRVWVGGCALHAGKRSASQLLTQRSPLSPVCRVELRTDPARHRRARGCCLRTAELPIPISCA